MLVITGKYGRMGNQIWTFANVLAFAHRHQISLVNIAFTDCAELFEGPSGRTLAPSGLSKNVGNWLLRLLYKINLRIKWFPVIELGEGGCLDLDNEISIPRHFGKSRFVFLSGFYFFAPQSLRQHKQEVRRYFSLRPELSGKVDALVGAAKKDADVLVGVHIRQGDYRTFCDGIMFYETDVYVALMQSIANQCVGRKVAFLVCSDEKQGPELFDGLNVTVSSSEPVVDMYALAQCDFIVGPNSSFSHWASFWGDVPLHVLDWKAAEAAGRTDGIRTPQLERDFAVFQPERFPEHCSHRVSIDAFFS